MIGVARPLRNLSRLSILIIVLNTSRLSHQIAAWLEPICEPISKYPFVQSMI